VRAVIVDFPTLRRMALALPEAEDGSDDRRLAFSVGGKGFAWTYLERTAPKKPRRPRLDVLAVRCLLERKEMLIEAASEKFSDDDHYRGFPAVLVRLAAVDESELLGRLTEAWRLAAPKALGRLHQGPLKAG
jgi:hypothetical protein